MHRGESGRAQRKLRGLPHGGACQAPGRGQEKISNNQGYLSVTGDCPNALICLTRKNSLMRDKNIEILETHHSAFDADVVLIQIQKDHHAYWVHALGEKPVAFGQLTHATDYAQGKLKSFYQ